MPSRLKKTIASRIRLDNSIEKINAVLLFCAASFIFPGVEVTSAASSWLFRAFFNNSQCMFSSCNYRNYCSAQLACLIGLVMLFHAMLPIPQSNLNPRSDIKSSPIIISNLSLSFLLASHSCAMQFITRCGLNSLCAIDIFA